MKYLCSFYNCKSDPEVYCKCQGLPKLICCQHILEHYKQDKLGAHKFIPAFKEIKNDEYDSIVNELRKMIEKNIKIKKIAIEQTEKLIQISGQFVNYLNKVNKYLNFNLSQTIKSKRVLIVSSFSKDDVSKLYKKDAIVCDDLRIIKSEAIKYFKMIDIRVSMEESFFKIFDHLSMEVEFSFGSGKNQKNLLHQNEIYFYLRNSKKFLEFNPQNESFQTLNIDSSMQINGSNEILCKIDDINLFAVFCEQKSLDNKNSNKYNDIKTYIINTSTMQVRLLDTGCVSMGISHQLYYKKVYVFGWKDNFNNYSDSKYFDLIINKWVSIASLPFSHYEALTLLLEPEILIAGLSLTESRSSVYCESPLILHSYHIFKNQYKQINNSLTKYRYNSLFLFQGIIYFLNGTDIYTCDDLEGKNKWVQVKKYNSYQIPEVRLSKPCYHGKYAYCYGDSEKIYRFDFEKLTLTSIKQ